MKRLLIGVIIPAAFVLAACTNSPEATTRKLQFLAKTDCELVYKSAGGSGGREFLRNGMETSHGLY